MIKFLQECNQLLWGNGLIILLLGTGVFCICSQKGKCLKSFRLLFQKNETAKNSISIFQSCMTSLAAAMGTGNIVGVASAFCGMGLIYAENVLSAYYRKNSVFGAAAYLKYGLKNPVLAGIFAICCVMASFGMGNMTQSHAMAEILEASFSVPAWSTGVFTMFLLYFIISGGAKRIAKFSAVMIPILTGIYLLCIFMILIRYRKNLPFVTAEIFRNAFQFKAIGGGTAGYAISVGIRRGVFSNEAGLGSSGLLHSEADAKSPDFLGVCGMLEVIADTFLCCTATAFAILCTGALRSETDGAVLVLNAFQKGIGNSANWILPPIIALFAFCTLIGWSFCGLNALKTITKNPVIWKCYQIFFCIGAFIGTVLKLEIVWTLADIANACMAYCNLPAIMLLYPQMQKRCTVCTAQR